MRLRNWSVLGVAIALSAVVSLAAHAEDGRPSRQSLEQMGLGSLVVMSDDDAMAVRGQGYGGGSYARVSGNSFATIGGKNGGAHSENGYVAEGKHHAKGSNSSYAGVVNVWIGGKRGGHNDKGGDWGKMPRGDKHGGGWGDMSRGDKHGGGWGKMPRGNKHGGGWGDMPRGNKHGGGYGGVKIRSTVVFAGGSSSAWAR